MALAGGLIAGAAIGGIASSAYVYGLVTATMAGTPKRITAMATAPIVVPAIMGAGTLCAPHTGMFIPAGNNEADDQAAVHRPARQHGVRVAFPIHPVPEVDIAKLRRRPVEPHRRADVRYQGCCQTGATGHNAWARDF